MSYPKGMHPGAVWKKTDFQIHTPRDAQWKGGDDLPGGDAESEAKRNMWADEFIGACIARGIDAIAITDHHDICMVPYVRAAIARQGKEKSIWLFPGVEVTCKDAVQALLLFDANATENELAAVFNGAIRNTGVHDQKAPKGPTIGGDGCGRRLDEFIKEAKSLEATKDKIIIIPHAGEGGHKTVLRDGFHNIFSELDCDGFYCEHHFSDFKVGSLRVFRGEIAEWGGRRRGIITTGDNRSSAYEKIGVYPCWVRLGEPTAESIRQALLADEARITYIQPESPSFRITHLTVDSRLTGQMTIGLNDGFNAIIGGRGSGKSALLEFLRFGLGRGALDMQVPSFIGDREKSLVRDTLGENGVTVTIMRNGVVERWRRSPSKKDVIIVESDGTEPQVIPVDEARNMFPARTYYQKELSTLGQSDGNIDERITKIAAADHDEARRSAEASVKAAQREVDAAFRAQVELWRTEASHASAARVATDIQRRIKQVSDSLSALNLSVEDQKTLSDQPLYSKANAFFKDSSAASTKLSSAIAAMISGLGSYSSAEWPQIKEMGDFNDVVAVGAAMDKAAKGVGAALMTAAQVTKEMSDTIQQHTVAFGLRQKTFDERYEKAAQNAAAHKNLLDQIKKLNSELEEAIGLEKRILQRVRELSGATNFLHEKRQALLEAVASRRKILEQAAEAVASQSNELLRASVCNEVPPRQICDAIRGLAENTRIQSFEEKKDAFASQLSDAAQLRAFCDALLSIYKHKIGAGDGAQVSVEVAQSIKETIKIGILTENQITGIYERLNDARVSESICAAGGHYIDFEYRDDGAYIAFGKASPGQQAAALLELLLNQDTGTLIIDQPEDDLDNKRVMTIAQRLHRSKSRRQIIFATHNANLLVNGDADKIIALTSGSDRGDEQHNPQQARIAVDIDGAIETPAIRERITSTMEGGEDAFRLRARKYHLHR